MYVARTLCSRRACPPTLLLELGIGKLTLFPNALYPCRPVRPRSNVLFGAVLRCHAGPGPLGAVRPPSANKGCPNCAATLLCAQMGIGIGSAAGAGRGCRGGGGRARRPRCCKRHRRARPVQWGAEWGGGDDDQGGVKRAFARDPEQIQTIAIGLHLIPGFGTAPPMTRPPSRRALSTPP